MLLCNGLFCSTHYYGPWWAHYASSYSLVQWDYRGHGRSDDPRDPHTATITQLADDAVQVLEATCQGKTIVVGHSMGVRIALEIYKRIPERVGALVLLCGSVFDSLGPVASRQPFRGLINAVLRAGYVLTPLSRILKDATVRSDVVPRVGYLLGGLSRTLTPREPVNKLLKNVDRLNVQVMSVLARSYIRHSSRDILPQVHVPTIFLVGEIDTLASPEHASQVSALLPDADQRVIAGCTHLAPIERPDLVQEAVDRFLERVR